MEATTTQRQQVTVTLGITNEEGETQIVQRTIPAGPIHVPVLKAELQVPEDSALWVIDKAGKKKVLGDHEIHDVKKGDHFEALVKGGVS